MNVVLEIGCQADPGPFFEGADKHYIVDPDAESLVKAFSKDTSFTPVVADASNLDFLEDANVNTFLARNVFCDPALFTDKAQRGMMQDELIALLAATKIAEARDFMMSVEAKCAKLKSDILQEAGRVLVAGGRFVAVEQQSPSTARRFFDAMAVNPAQAGGLDIQPASLAAVAPASYVEHQQAAYPITLAWTAQKH